MTARKGTTSFARLVSFDPRKPFSLAELGRRLGVDAKGAQRQLEAFVREHGYLVKCVPGESAAFFLEDPHVTVPPPSRSKPKKKLADQKTDVTQQKGPQSSVTMLVRGIDALFSSAEDARLGLPLDLERTLSPDELFPLRILAREQSARTSELAARLGRPIARMGGLMRALRRKLHVLGHELFTVEELPGGEAMYRFAKKGSHERRG